MIDCEKDCPDRYKKERQKWGYNSDVAIAVCRYCKHKQLEKAEATIKEADRLWDIFVTKNMSIPMKAAEANEAVDLLRRYLRD